MNPELWHYDMLEQWHNIYYKDVFLPSHLTGDEIAVREEDNLSFFFIAKKGQPFFLIPSHIIESGEIPFRALETVKDSVKGKAYWKVKKIQCVKIKEEQTMSYKQMIDTWMDYEHENKRVFTLWKIIVDTFYCSRINVRVMTYAGWMKDSPVFALSRLRGNCFTVNKPSIAKLKYLLNNNTKGIGLNEIQKLDAKERSDLSKFYEDVGDFKTIFINPTRASGGVQEQSNISNLSTFTFTNFPDCRHTKEEQQQEVFDVLFDPKVRSRVMPLLFTGGTETEPACKQRFNHLVEKITPEQADEITCWLRNHSYYEAHGKELAVAKPFTTTYRLSNTRWDRNFQAITERIKLYAETQEEFEKLVALLWACNKRYTEWLDSFNRLCSEDDDTKQMVIEEIVMDKSPKEQILDELGKVSTMSVEELEKKFPDWDIDNYLKELAKAGDIFEPKRGWYAVLK